MDGAQPPLLQEALHGEPAGDVLGDLVKFQFEDGGDGGSVTILGGNRQTAKRTMLDTISQANDRYRNIPIYLSRHGLRVWESR